MSGASWLSWSLAALMAAIASYHSIRLVVAHRRRHYREADVDLTHAAMGAVMAMMLIGGLSLRTSVFWATGFTAAASWFTLRTLLGYVRGGAAAVTHPLQEVVLSSAMLLMLTGTATSVRVSTGSPQMAGMAAPGVGRWTILLLVAAVVTVALQTTAGLSRQNQHGSSSAGLLAPRATAGCRLAMNATTVYMLLLLA